jgi:hypothetical protein
MCTYGLYVFQVFIVGKNNYTKKLTINTQFLTTKKTNLLIFFSFIYIIFIINYKINEYVIYPMFPCNGL